MLLGVMVGVVWGEKTSWTTQLDPSSYKREAEFWKNQESKKSEGGALGPCEESRPSRVCFKRPWFQPGCQVEPGRCRPFSLWPGM